MSPPESPSSPSSSVTETKAMKKKKKKEKGKVKDKGKDLAASNEASAVGDDLDQLASQTINSKKKNKRRTADPGPDPDFDFPSPPSLPGPADELSDPSEPTLEDKIRATRPPPRVRISANPQPGFVSLNLENVAVTFRNQEVLTNVSAPAYHLPLLAGCSDNRKLLPFAVLCAPPPRPPGRPLLGGGPILPKGMFTPY